MATSYDDKTALVLSKDAEARGDYPPSYENTSQAFDHNLDDQTIRQHFIRKVFVILCTQLLFTLGVVCACTYSWDMKVFVQSNPALYYVSFAVFFVCLIALACCRNVQRKYPWNLLCLALLTVCLSYMVGMIASFHDTASVVIALGTTVAVCLGIILFSLQTRLDLTYCYSFLLVFSIVVLMFGFFCIFFYSQVLQVVYGCLGALLFCLFLAVDIQLVLGKNQLSLSPEEYIFAALVLYLDIVSIFTFVLMLVGNCRN
ncbi:protein lifeguard 1 [Leucoraja erinacea]|uniref:protein lifeguard 1 n=1 Tax=Leucoraja erinaceus TaxID=7782 RepID=UPI0024571B01|nr:protein lifeguard 1 [Leucoraja erinacea]